jgi:hypothetical protein
VPTVTALPEFALGGNGKSAILVAPVSKFRAAPVLGADNIVRDLPVFKARKVKDSLGRESTWTIEDLDAMVANFNLLKDSNLFPNVPVRANHGRDVNDVGGWYVALRRDGDTLLADIEFTEPDMAEKYRRGTYRNRSIEIGAYETNDGEIYFPTVMGLAFCDIPAVEGLFSASASAYSGTDSEVLLFAPAADAAEGGGSDTQDTTGGTEPWTAVLVALHGLAGHMAADADGHAAVLRVIQAIEGIQNGGDSAAEGSDPAPTTNAGASVDTFKFSLDGREIDVAGDDSTKAILSAFSSKVTELTETVSTLTADAEKAKQEFRAAAVDGWRDSKKITPAQVDGMKAYVATLTDEQFTAHSALIEATPVLSFTAEQGGTGGENVGPDRDKTIADLRLTYSMLSKAGLTKDKLAESKPAKALAALGVAVEA